MDNLIDPKTAIYTAKIVSFSTAFIATGYSFSFSQNVLPAILDHKPQFSTTAFKQIWGSAGSLIPVLHTASISASVYLAYALPEQRQEWMTSAMAMFFNLPWTLFMMAPTASKLQDIAEKKALMVKSEQNLEYRQLLVSWMKQNHVSVALQLASAILAVRAAVKA